MLNYDHFINRFDGGAHVKVDTIIECLAMSHAQIESFMGDTRDRFQKGVEDATERILHEIALDHCGPDMSVQQIIEVLAARIEERASQLNA